MAMSASVTATRLPPSSPPHWRIVVAATGVGPSDVIELVDDDTGARPDPAGRLVLTALKVSAGAGGATEAAPVLATVNASPGLATTVATFDPIADGSQTSEAHATPIPYAVHPDGPLYLHPGVDAGTARIDAVLLIVGGWVAR